METDFSKFLGSLTPLEKDFLKTSLDTDFRNREDVVFVVDELERSLRPKLKWK